MADLFPTNTNLPPGWLVPGVYTQVILSDPGAVAPNNRALLLGYALPSGTAPLNTPVLGVTESQVESGCGRGSMLHKMFLSAKAQLGPAGAGAEIWLVPLAAPAAGVAATHQTTFLPAPTYDAVNSRWVLGTNTAALATTICDIYIAGRKEASFVVQTGDTFAQLATKAAAELAKVADLPVSYTVATATITYTDLHKGAHGNDLPIRVDFADPACGVAASCGTLTVAAGPAGADGSMSVKFLGAKTCTAAIANADSNVTASGKLAAAINADAYPVLAAEPTVPTGVITMFHRPGRIAHRISTSVTGIAPQTLTAAVGTAGAGLPTLTAALTNLAADNSAYLAWAVPFDDTTTWGTLASHIEGQSISPIEKGQVAHGCVTTGLTDAGTLPSGTSPALTSSARYVMSWYQGSPNRGWEIAARCAAMVAARQMASLNFNFAPLTGSDAAPIAAAHRADRPTLTEVNTALGTYFLNPITVNTAGVPSVVRSTTTYKPVGSIDQKLTKWSCILTLDYYRADLRAYLFGLFGKDKKLKTRSPARTSLAATPDTVKAAVYRRVLSWDDKDLYDGGEQARDAILAGVLVLPTRVDVALPMRPPADLDQLSVVGYQQ